MKNKVVVINGHKIHTLSQLYIYLARRLKFPDYFGHNLDALVDCLCDLEEVVEIKIWHKDWFLSEENDDKKEIVKKIFADAEMVKFGGM